MKNQLHTNQGLTPLSWIEPSSPSVDISTESAEDAPRNAAEQIFAKREKIGRPVSITEAYKYILARDGALKYAETIAKDALEAKNARDRLAAASEMADRTDGKATQRIDARGVFMVMAPDAGLVQTVDSWAD